MHHTASADARRLFVLAVCLLSLGLCYPVFASFYAPAGGGLDVTGHPLGRDFINFWAAPQVAFSADASALFDIGRYNALLTEKFGHALPPHWWSYPPVVLPLLWPLKHLPYFAALALWTGLGLAAYASATLSAIERAQRPLALLCLLALPATLITIVGGQNGFFTGALFVGAVSLLERRPIFAGVLLGLLTFKPHLGTVLPLALVALAAWRTIAAAAVTASLLYGASVAILGLSFWQTYAAVTVPIQLEWMKAFDGFFTSMLVSVTAGVLQVGGSFDLAMRVQAVVTVVVVLAAAWGVRQTRDTHVRLLVLASAAPLATPWCFNYDLPLLSAAWLIYVLQSGRGAFVGGLVGLVPILVMRTGTVPLLSQAILVLGFIAALRLVRNEAPTIRSLMNLRHSPASHQGPRACSSPTTR